MARQMMTQTKVLRRAIHCSANLPRIRHEQSPVTRESRMISVLFPGWRRPGTLQAQRRESRPGRSTAFVYLSEVGGLGMIWASGIARLHN